MSMTGVVTVLFRPDGDPDTKPNVYNVKYDLDDREVQKAVEQYVSLKAQSAMRGYGCPKFIVGWTRVK